MNENRSNKLPKHGSQPRGHSFRLKTEDFKNKYIDSLASWFLPNVTQTGVNNAFVGVFPAAD